MFATDGMADLTTKDDIDFYIIAGRGKKRGKILTIGRFRCMKTHN